MTIASNLSFLQNSAGAITTGTVNAIGSPITFSVNNTEYNRIDTNGYSLMGYTTSQGAYKLQVNGTIYASGSIIGNITGNVTGTVTTSSNVAGGTAGQLVYQSAPGITGFTGPGTSGQLLVSAGASAPVYTNTASIYVNSARYADNITAGTTGQLVYQSAANTTSFVGPGTSGQLLVSAGASAPVYTTTSTIQVGYSANILAGTTGQLVYQSAANTTSFVGPGTSGQFLQSAGAGAPTYVSTGTMYVQRAVQADSAVGGAGSVANALTISTGLSGSPSTSYNGSAAITLTLNTATLMASAVQVSNSLSAGTGLTGSAFNGSTAQTWTLNTATLMASSVAIAGGTTGQLHYQSAANTTGFVGPGTAGQFLQSAGAGAPTYVSTGTMYVQRAVLADSVTGSAGSLANALTIGTGLSGTSGTYNGSAAVTVSLNTTTLMASAVQVSNSLSAGTGLTGSAFNGSTAQTWTLNTATLMASSVNIAGGTTGQLHYQSAANTTGFVGPGTAGQFLQSAGAGAPTYVSTTTMYVQRAVQADSASAGAGYTGNINATANTNLFEYIVGVSASGSTSAAATVATSNPVGFNASSGNVGIGTTSPGQKLEVAGNIYVNTSGNPYLQLKTSGAGNNPYIRMTADTNSWDIQSTFSNTNDDLLFMYNATTALTLDNAGKVSIGTAPPYGTSRLTLVASSNPTTTTDGANQLSIGEASQNTAYSLKVGYISINGGYSGSVQAIAGGVGGPLLLNGAGGNVAIGNTNPSQKLHVTGNTIITGNIVIGSTTTTNKFEVVGTTGQLFSVSDSFTGTIFSASDVSGIPSIEVLDTGLVKLAQYNGQVTISTGTVVSGSGLSVWTTTYILSLGVGTAASGTIGEIRATNEITAYYSDRRLKENVQVIDNALVKVLSLTGITYTPNAVAESYGYDRNSKLVGVFADDVESVLPEAVRPAPFDIDETGNSKSGENYKTVQYEKIVPLLIEAIKEQQKAIDSLRSELEQLKSKF
jgi:hypothetical protein